MDVNTLELDGGFLEWKDKLEHMKAFIDKIHQNEDVIDAIMTLAKKNTKRNKENYTKWDDTRDPSWQMGAFNLEYGRQQCCNDKVIPIYGVTWGGIDGGLGCNSITPVGTLHYSRSDC